MCKLKTGTSSRYLISFLPFYFLLYIACYTFKGKNFPNGLALEELSQYKAEPRFDRSLGKKTFVWMSAVNRFILKILSSLKHKHEKLTESVFGFRELQCTCISLSKS